ncbi:ATP-dependent Lon protease [Arboricoccus pini]|uniref:Lon protease n=1 Tax=Arboricoccus pini TaxID=1963835 RepID=A0A212R7V6_9PROT|nr:endopeptidase La [Arboricoccus pini]SNB68242.1 ATP-dependent Lon protease [Arboricoccus pini]
MADNSPAGSAPAQDANLALLPLKNLVVFPGSMLPVVIEGKRAIAAAQQAVRQGTQVGLVLCREGAPEDPGLADIHQIGTVANILRYVTAPDGATHLVVQGIERFSVQAPVAEEPVLTVQARRMPDPEERTAEIEARFVNLRNLATEALQLLPQPPQELLAAISASTSPGGLADLAATYMDASAREKQDVLETIPLAPRIERVTALLGHRIEVMRLSAEIGKQTRASLDDRQREVLLREQMAAIQKQLGEDDGKAAEIAELTKAIEAAQMPDDVATTAKKEVRRLERTPEQSAEYGMIRSYLDWLIELPWAMPEEKSIDLDHARSILDSDHFGLDKIKQRIMEYLAVRKLSPTGKAPILCFVGPPGVGKTSLGQSIARAMGRPFVRVSLGGVHDESEIRGHRRTYIGALPGNIIQGIRKAGARDAVVMLDEIDKMGRGIQGDPSAAMLEVLDPEQNATFRDAYLGVPYDLSRTVFIATANMLDNIPGPLRDRMEIISLAGYTEAEKFEIAKRYLLDRQKAANGLSDVQVTIDDAALRQLIRSYTREAGVRGLEREIGRLMRHVAVGVASGKTTARTIHAEDLESILGPSRFESEVAMRTSIPGVATGLAWTPVGGDILFIEAARVPGRGNLIVTGQLGEVMRESVQAALSLVKARTAALGIDSSAFERSDIHVHVPAGATPKDGPSAGVAMVVALSSLLTGRTVRSDTAMTGEISLRGLVLPVGGIKEKVVAAAAADIKRVLLPARNRHDFVDIPDDVRQALEFVWLDTVDQALEAALESAAEARAA